MAYVQTPIPQEEQNQQAPSGQTTANPSTQMPPDATETGGSVGQGGNAAAPSKVQGAGTSTQFGTNASKLSDYLSANQDQVQGMGQNIAGTLNQNYNQLYGDVNQAGKDFANTVAGSYAAPNPELVGRATSNPTEFVKNPNDVSAFQAQLNNTYSGPTSFESTAPYADVQGRVNQAVQGSGLLNTHAGLSSYLQNNVEKNPTPGQNTLDTVLLESEPQAIKSVQDAVAPFAGLTNYLTNTANSANAGVRNAQDQASTAKAAAQSSFNGPDGIVPKFKSGLDSRVQQSTTERDAYNSEVSDILSKYESGQPLTQKEMQDTGLANGPTNDFTSVVNALNSYKTGAQNAVLFPYMTNEGAPTLSNYLFPAQSQNYSIPTASNISTPDDYAYANALNQLSGNDLGFLNQSDLGQAGTYETGKISPIDLNPIIRNSLQDLTSHQQVNAQKYPGGYGQYNAVVDPLIQNLMQNLYPVDQGRNIGLSNGKYSLNPAQPPVIDPNDPNNHILRNTDPVNLMNPRPFTP